MEEKLTLALSVFLGKEVEFRRNNETQGEVLFVVEGCEILATRISCYRRRSDGALISIEFALAGVLHVARFDLGRGVWVSSDMEDSVWWVGESLANRCQVPLIC